MKNSIMITNNILSIINNSLINLTIPMIISIWWNFGSLLGLCLMTQIITGLLLSKHYIANINLAFNKVIHIMQDVNYGWLLWVMHMNGASMSFTCMFIHIGQNLYYNTFKSIKPWNIGVIIFLVTMMTAFMKFMVITNLLSAVPYISNSTVSWLWSGFSMNNGTLNRYYTFHFIMPFIVLSLVMLHLIMLHEVESSNPLGLNSNFNKIPLIHTFLLNIQLNL